MWDNILTADLALYMVKVSDETEDADSIEGFFLFMQKEVTHRNLMILIASQWQLYSPERQVEISVKYGRNQHASRFIMMMDYLSHKYKEGKLK